MAGTLTIHSSGDGHITSGHSWIEYKPDGGDSTTYGTWGNNPDNLGNGLHQDLEKGTQGDAHRSERLTDEQEKKLFEKIKKYQGRGEKGWGYLNPCSSFAADAWHAATGETLAHRSGPISNPSKLKKSIEAANKKQEKKKAKDSRKSHPRRPASSRRKVKSLVQSCC